MRLLDFQLKALGELLNSTDNNNRDILYKSPTGSGKTVVLSHFMNEYLSSHANTVFIWLTPGKGNLEEQSKKKMDKYIHNSSTKLIYEVLDSGFAEDDCCFINWEMITNKKNNALRESEFDNLVDKIESALEEGLTFIVIIDESHLNATYKASKILELFSPSKIIYASATPKTHESAILVEVSEETVIAQGLIKEKLIINEGFTNDQVIDNSVEYLLNKGICKSNTILEEYSNLKKNIVPLVIVQLENDNEQLLFEVESYLMKSGYTYENGKLAIWLSKKKENLQDIELNHAQQRVVITKQAIATGWDCPRAHILIKLRGRSSETFEIQTIGRIRRMPEVKHYNNSILDSCYLYTFDEKFKEGVKIHLGYNALNAYDVFLKTQFIDFTLPTELKSSVAIPRDSRLALSTMYNFFTEKYSLTSNLSSNKEILISNNFKFNDYLSHTTSSGEISQLDEKSFESLEKVVYTEKLDTHNQGREYHNKVARLGVKLSLPYDQMNTIIRRLFDKSVKSKFKLLNLNTREIYGFIISNYPMLLEAIRSAISDPKYQPDILLKTSQITVQNFKFPLNELFTYNEKNRVQKKYSSNVYDNYLSSAEYRSDSEKEFERFCEVSSDIQWFYKNGDKGLEYLSIVYLDNFGKQKSFYPDYIISVNKSIWIIETKGGFSRNGDSEDIDKFSPKKFNELQRYLKKYKLKGGFVRKDKLSNELFICTKQFDNNISGENWTLLSDTIKSG